METVAAMIEFIGRKIHFRSKVKFPLLQCAQQDVLKLSKLNRIAISHFFIYALGNFSF